MQPGKELIDEIYRNKVIRARRVPIEDKLLSGGEIFEQARLRMIWGIRSQYPTADDDEVGNILRDRFRRLRALRDHDVRQ